MTRLINQKVKSTTDNLLKRRRTYGTGVGSILEIYPDTLNSEFIISDTPKAADLKALRSDWEMVGQDLRNAAEELG